MRRKEWVSGSYAAPFGYRILELLGRVVFSLGGGLGVVQRSLVATYRNKISSAYVYKPSGEGRVPATWLLCSEDMVMGYGLKGELD